MKRALWPAAALAGALYVAMLAWSLPHLSGLAGGRLMFDMRPGGYGLAEARALLEALGPAGRSFYLEVQQRLDTAFPAAEALTLGLAFPRLLPRRIALGLTLAAVLGAGFDYAENFAVAAMLRAGPEGLTDAMVATASRWTVLKSAFDTVALGGLAAGLGLAVWRRWRRR